MSASLVLDPRSGCLLEIPDGEGEVHLYRCDPAGEGLDAWACRVERAGEEGHGPYRVAVSPRGAWRCSCPWYTKGRQGRAKRTCKHVEAIAPMYAFMRRLWPAGGTQ